MKKLIVTLTLVLTFSMYTFAQASQPYPKVEVCILKLDKTLRNSNPFETVIRSIGKKEFIEDNTLYVLKSYEEVSKKQLMNDGSKESILPKNCSIYATKASKDGNWVAYSEDIFFEKEPKIVILFTLMDDFTNLLFSTEDSSELSLLIDMIVLSLERIKYDNTN